MLDPLRSVEVTGKLPPAAAVRRRRAAPAESFRLAPAPGVPATPPPEVLQALDDVQRVASELKARGLGVRFEANGDRRVTAQVVDAAGSVVREIPVVQALDALSGERPVGELVGA